MEGQLHFLEVYEPYEYHGTNPIPVSGTGRMRGPNGAFYYLLSVTEPFDVDSERVEQILVLPRYSEDAIKRAEEGDCTVTIARVLPGVELRPMGPLNLDDIAHWGVGKITNASST